MNISFILNGNKVKVEVSPEKPLLRVLREDLDVMSVKEGCGRGECGTCTVLLDEVPVTSCMVAAGQVRGREITTLEGLESSGAISDLQQAFKEAGAVQCGFCTPGFIISAYALLKENPDPSRDEIRVAVSGNICRCTGYTKIIDAIELAAKYNKGLNNEI
ncbi:MAG: (2Fe-2S)-binding protein [Elusimicrobia bacterium]|jgi:aerobic-type carbon monoxide dehydrogenase small subunit (CoxS/CutS family)|nr:(2Fe-2S)-binding protein [Elusimicrobiota bacterium]